MVKIMRPVQNLSLRKSLVLYIVLFVMFALALSIMTASVYKYFLFLSIVFYIPYFLLICIQKILKLNLDFIKHI